MAGTGLKLKDTWPSDRQKGWIMRFYEFRCQIGECSEVKVVCNHASPESDEASVERLAVADATSTGWYLMPELQIWICPYCARPYKKTIDQGS